MNEIHRTLLVSFLKAAKASGRREQGILGLRFRVPKFFVYLDEFDYTLRNVHVREAQGYIGWLKEQKTKAGTPYSSRTIKSFVGAASQFCEYLKQEYIMLSNPFKEVQRVRAEKKLPRHIASEKDIHTILEHASRFTVMPGTLKHQKSRYKLHVAAELMYATGLRVSEVAALTPSDIDFDRNTIQVKEGKGGYSRTVFLNEYAAKVLELFVRKLRPLVLTERNNRHRDLLFGSGWQWFGKLVNGQLEAVCRETETNPITAHGFRHALGFHLLRAGCPIRYIQQILGHKCLRNIEIYTKVDKKELKNILDTCHPRQWKADRSE